VRKAAVSAAVAGAVAVTVHNPTAALSVASAVADHQRASVQNNSNNSSSSNNPFPSSAPTIVVRQDQRLSAAATASISTSAMPSGGVREVNNPFSLRTSTPLGAATGGETPYEAVPLVLMPAATADGAVGMMVNGLRRPGLNSYSASYAAPGIPGAAAEDDNEPNPFL
jgi:hypothetical protein